MNFRDWYYKQIVTESEMDEAFGWVEDSIWEVATDNDLVGVHSASEPAQHGLGDLTVDVPGPLVATGKEGERIYIADSTTNLDCTVDEYGVSTAVVGAANSKILSVFVRFKRRLEAPETDGNGATIYTEQFEDAEIFLRQGAEAVVPSAPPLMSSALLLGDITLTFSQTQILAGDIDVTRAETWLRYVSPTFGTIAKGDAKAAFEQVLANIDTLVSGLPFSFTSTWFGSVAVAGASPPVTDVQEALDAIVYDLAQSTGSDLVGTPDVSLTYVSWASAAVTGALSALATAIDNHIGGSAPRHTASVIDSSAYSWIASTDVQAALQEIVDDLAATGAGSEGATRIGVSAHSFVTGATEVQGFLEELIDDLASTTLTGAAQIGIDTTNTSSGLSWGISGSDVRAKFVALQNAISSNTGTDGAARVGFLDGATPSSVRAKLLSLESAIDTKLSKIGADVAVGPINVVGNLIADKPAFSFWPPDSAQDYIARKQFTDSNTIGAYPHQGANVFSGGAGYEFCDIASVTYDRGDGLGTRWFSVACFGTGATGDTHLVMIDPLDMSTAVIDTTVRASASIEPAAMCASGSNEFYVIYNDDTFRKYTITGGAFVEDTSGSWPVSLPASSVALNDKDRMICVGSDIVLALGNLPTNGGTGPLFRYDKNGALQTSGFGATLVGSANETVDGGLACDGTDVYLSLYDTTSPSGRVVAINLANMAADGVNGPWSTGQAHCMDLLFDGWNLWVPQRIASAVTAVKLGVVNDPGGTPTWNNTEFVGSVAGGATYDANPLNMAFDGTNVWLFIEDDDTTDNLYLEKFPCTRYNGANDSKAAAAQALAAPSWTCGSNYPARVACDGAFIWYGSERDGADIYRLPNPATR